MLADAICSCFPVHECPVCRFAQTFKLFKLLIRVYSWVIIPLWLMWDSYGHVANALRFQQASSKAKKN